MRKLRKLSIALSLWGLLTVAVVVVASQVQEWNTLKEVPTVASAIAFLGLASFAVSWSKIGSDVAPVQELRCAKQAGLDLFLASILTVVSEFLILAAPSVKSIAGAFAQVVLVAHALILLLAWVIAWLAMRRLLLLISKVSDQPS